MTSGRNILFRSIGKKQELVNLKIKPMTFSQSNIIDSRHPFRRLASFGGWEHSAKKVGGPVVHLGKPFI